MGKVIKLLAPSAENENTHLEAPVIKKTEKQSYHTAKNFRKYLTKPVAWTWEMKNVWKTWENDYLQHLETNGRKLITFHILEPRAVRTIQQIL